MRRHERTMLCTAVPMKSIPHELDIIEEAQAHPQPAGRKAYGNECFT